MAYVDAKSAVATADVDALSLAELTHRFRPALKAYFKKRAPDGVDAEDLVQDVFVRLARRGDIHNIRQVEGYLFQTAANVLTDRVRYRIARRRDDYIAWREGDHPAEESAPAAVLIGTEAIAGLLAALAELPERRRTVFLLNRVDGLRYGEIAEWLGIPRSSVEKHMIKALAHLAAWLEAHR
ncbi:MAG TPA: RNA polymerase sigma factor [Woeseiaceae bacterium]|nr:RNA polymerase sigma factor [Woeseiaceae bacterium]